MLYHVKLTHAKRQPEAAIEAEIETAVEAAKGGDPAITRGA